MYLNLLDLGLGMEFGPVLVHSKNTRLVVDRDKPRIFNLALSFYCLGLGLLLWTRHILPLAVHLSLEHLSDTQGYLGLLSEPFPHTQAL